MNWQDLDVIRALVMLLSSSLPSFTASVVHHPTRSLRRATIVVANQSNVVDELFGEIMGMVN